MKKKDKKNQQFKSLEKIETYLSHLKEDQKFNNQVSEIRKIFGLPKKGFSKRLADELFFINKIEPKTKEDEGGDFQKMISNLASRYDLDLPWLESVTNYVLYDNFFISEIAPLVELINVSNLIDTKTKKNRTINQTQIIQNVSDGFPIAVLISPYATGNDIIDYIQKNRKKNKTITGGT